MILSDFALMIYFLLKEQSHYVQEYKRMQELAALMEQVPSLLIFEQRISCDVRPGREEERWINILARRI